MKNPYYSIFYCEFDQRPIRSRYLKAISLKVVMCEWMEFYPPQQLPCPNQAYLDDHEDRIYGFWLRWKLTWVINCIEYFEALRQLQFPGSEVDSTELRTITLPRLLMKYMPLDERTIPDLVRFGRNLMALSHMLQHTLEIQMDRRGVIHNDLLYGVMKRPVQVDAKNDWRKEPINETIPINELVKMHYQNRENQKKLLDGFDDESLDFYIDNRRDGANE